MITINDLDRGMALMIDGNIYLVTEYHHVKPGKGAAFVRVNLRNIKTDAALERTFRTADKLEDVPLEEVELEFLYKSEDGYHFMNHDTYEEMVISESLIGDAKGFLLENLAIMAWIHNHQVLRVTLPNFIVAEIIETEPGFRGDSKTSSTKPAKIASGATVLVPMFINAGETVKIDTRTGVYVERILK